MKQFFSMLLVLGSLSATAQFEIDTISERLVILNGYFAGQRSEGIEGTLYHKYEYAKYALEGWDKLYEDLKRHYGEDIELSATAQKDARVNLENSKALYLFAGNVDSKDPEYTILLAHNGRYYTLAIQSKFL